MAEIILDALRAAIGAGQGSGLRRWYHPECTLECFANRRAEVIHGAPAVLAAWPRTVGPGGRLTAWSVTAAAGGYEVMTQRDTVRAGRLVPVRQLHQVHVRDDRILLHLVSPATPHEPPTLVDAPAAGLLPGTVAEFTHDGLSGAALFRARLPSGRPVVVKVVRPGRDWLAVASHDPGREGRLHTLGVYAALPPGLRAPVLSARQHDGVWTIVMEDISAELNAAPSHPAREILTAVAGMHTQFRGRPPRAELCSPADRLRVFSPLQRLLHWHGSDNFPAMTGRMWELFAERADPRLAHAVLQLVADPVALLASLARAAPDTLLHGDLRPPNLGRRGDTVLAIDWGLSAYGPADLDFVYYLYNTAWGDDAERDALEAEWLRMTDAPPHSPAYELSVIYHTVAGELGVLLATAANRPHGLPRPSEETVSWWIRRVRTAFDRMGHVL